ncbi:MAG TPA: tRNA (adenosine(37)-N6)-threonylcarbamoyltransferase complex ATPase subunit type 1 TsaE [Candidatus Avisuccinivibrio pullicola]|nr:tRNA (adenosine(37)-N6)-threonylcarbamoyltransferase complex ATPase subunit type 1 TsaE [Candidatus Avisuccinivibrio pullicola]
MTQPQSLSLDIHLPDEASTLMFGGALYALLRTRLGKSDHALMVYLEGDLGAGKTCLSRGLISLAGYEGVVKSPTFTIVEPYALKDGQQEITIYHFDLYRLSDPEELLYMGGRDYFASQALCLVEWPEKGAGVLPAPDLTVTLQRDGEGRRALVTGPVLDEQAHSEFLQLYAQLQQKFHNLPSGA